MIIHSSIIHCSEEHLLIIFSLILLIHSKKEKTMLSTALWTRDTRSESNNMSGLYTEEGPSRSLSSTEGDESSESMENSN